MKKQEIFKNACYSDNPQEYLICLTKQTTDKQVLANIEFVLTKTQISNICCQCKKTIEKESFDYVAGYWTPHHWKAVCTHHKKEYIAYETLECQTIDSNCNDCKHFKRGNIQGKLTKEHSFLAVDFMFSWEETRTWEEKGEPKSTMLRKSKLAKEGDIVTMNGLCNKKQISVHATPNICTGYTCFEHRRGEAEWLKHINSTKI